MAGLDPRVENLDEFDEAEEMSATFCQQITEQEYEDQTSEETEKALNELCSYLQENPEVYFRILRKRKQEELESAGIFSYLKVKMMSILHGEQYPACLVSPKHSTQQLNQLRIDMQKAFTYSEESKGCRYSKRLASRSGMAGISNDKENTPLPPSQHPPRRTRLESESQDATTPVRDAERGKRVLRSAAQKKPKPPLGLAKLGAPPIMAVMPSKTSTSSQAPLSAPPPPPPPPPPPLLPQHRVTDMNQQQSQGIQTKKTLNTPTFKGSKIDGNRSVLARSPLTSVQVQRQSLSGSLLTGTAEQSYKREEHETMEVSSGGGGSVTPSGSTPSSPSDNEFVTPEADIPTAKKHKRTLSSVSTGSTGSQCSLSTIHTELMSSNPLARLRSTQVARSPGGTPLRTLNGSRTSSEPLHKALATVLKQKFKNVRTPSPLAASSVTSVNSPDPALSKNNSLNATFSP